ncbi:MAG: hypothetical protein OEV87_10590 [Phycisphaerae bacterium]|nr:hypothetical protein [Phycisphaerae bacterium]
MRLRLSILLFILLFASFTGLPLVEDATAEEPLYDYAISDNWAGGLSYWLISDVLENEYKLYNNCEKDSLCQMVKIFNNDPSKNNRNTLRSKWNNIIGSETEINNIYNVIKQSYNPINLQEANGNTQNNLEPKDTPLPTSPGFSLSPAVAGTLDYIQERMEQETVFVFLEKLNESLSDNPRFEVLFPHTNRMIKEMNYATFNQLRASWREAHRLDLDELPEVLTSQDKLLTLFDDRPDALEKAVQISLFAHAYRQTRSGTPYLQVYQDLVDRIKFHHPNPDEMFRVLYLTKRLALENSRLEKTVGEKKLLIGTPEQIKLYLYLLLADLWPDGEIKNFLEANKKIDNIKNTINNISDYLRTITFSGAEGSLLIKSKIPALKKFYKCNAGENKEICNLFTCNGIDDLNKIIAGNIILSKMLIDSKNIINSNISNILCKTLSIRNNIDTVIDELKIHNNMPMILEIKRIYELHPFISTLKININSIRYDLEKYTKKIQKEIDEGRGGKRDPIYLDGLNKELKITIALQEYFELYSQQIDNLSKIMVELRKGFLRAEETFEDLRRINDEMRTLRGLAEKLQKPPDGLTPAEKSAMYGDFLNAFTKSLTLSLEVVQRDDSEKAKAFVAKTTRLGETLRAVSDIQRAKAERNYTVMVQRLLDLMESPALGDQIETGGTQPQGASQIVNRKIDDNLKNFIYLSANVAQAKTDADVLAVYRQFAAPVASYRRKREDGASTWSITTYPGIAFSKEWLLDNNDKKHPSNNYSVAIPIGVETSRGFGSSSLAIHLSLLDLGIATSYRNSTDTYEQNGKNTTESYPQIGLKELIAPGLFIFLGASKSNPIAIGFGYQQTKAIREVKDPNRASLGLVRTRRAMLIFAYDLPLYFFR